MYHYNSSFPLPMLANTLYSNVFCKLFSHRFTCLSILGGAVHLSSGSLSTVSSRRVKLAPWISMLDAKESSWLSPSRCPTGRLFRIVSASRRVSFIHSKVNLNFPSHLNKKIFIKSTILSKNPPTHRVLDKLNFLFICNFASIVLISLFCS